MRHPTTAHPWCTCTPHTHDDGQCVGTQIIYQQPDGTHQPGTCRILGHPVLRQSRQGCPLHGGAA